MSLVTEKGGKQKSDLIFSNKVDLEITINIDMFFTQDYHKRICKSQYILYIWKDDCNRAGANRLHSAFWVIGGALTSGTGRKKLPYILLASDIPI